MSAQCRKYPCKQHKWLIRPYDQYISIQTLKTAIRLNHQAPMSEGGRDEKQRKAKGQRPLMRTGIRPNPSANQYDSEAKHSAEQSYSSIPA